MKQNKKILFATVVVLAVLIAALLSTVIFAEDKDISRPGTTSKVTLDSVDILRELGVTLSDAEKSYLTVYGESTVSYGSHIPTSNIALNYDAASSRLSVNAKAYEYTITSGAVVSWIPVSVTMGERTLSLTLSSDGEHFAELSDVTESDDLYLTVLYKTDVDLSVDFINSLLNKGYNDAVAWDKYKTYLDSLAKYEADKILYQNYLVSKRVYDEKLGAYKVYLDELSEYEARLAEYEAYVEAMKVYNAEYEKYLKYLEEKKVYEEKLSQYNIYVENLKTVENQLAAFEATKRASTSHRRSVYSAIHGNLVKLVMENKDLIANEFIGASGSAVDDAGASTDALKEIYKEYYSCETVEEKYTYYAINYREIKDNFIKLFNALDKLYRNAKVRIAIDEQGYKVKFEIFLAQLYYTVLSLSDEPVYNFEGDTVYDGSYRINRKTPLSLLEGEEYILDTGAAMPLPSGYPAYREKPTITVYPEPTKPAQKLQPIAPTKVENPGEEPSVVLKPTAPSYVSAPFGLTDGAPIPDVALALLAEYRTGNLALRTPPDSPKSLAFEISVNKKVFNAKEIVVTFCDEGGNRLYSTVAEQGSYAEFIGEVPYKAENERATYTFAGWADSSGNRIDVTSVLSDVDIILYPYFEEKLKSYDVVWEIDDTLVITSAAWGEIPSLGYIPTRPDSDRYYYTFAGWNKELSPVVGDTQTDRYFASFDREYIVPVLNGKNPIGGALVTKNGEAWSIDCTIGSVGSSYTRLRVDLSYLFTRVSEMASFSIVTTGFTAQFSYSDALLMQKEGVRYFELSTSQSASRFTFVPHLISDAGATVDSAAAVALDFHGFSFAEADVARVYRVIGGKTSHVSASVGKSSLTLSVPCSGTYYVAAEYEVHVLPTGPVELEILGDVNLPYGESFEIRYTVPLGVRLNSVYMIDRYGLRTDISGEIVEMPVGGCRIGVDYEYIEYTVNFISSGKIIGTRICRYGEMPEMLADPIRTSDGVFRYTFDKWRNSTTGTSEITPVTSNVNYEALFIKEKIPEKPPVDGLIISDSVLQKLVKIALYAGFILLVLIPCGIIAIVKISVRIRRKAPRKTGKRGQ